ncbi:hypothetical protein Plhal304r1_c001g0002561 [Plasmopara halstedii]
MSFIVEMFKTRIFRARLRNFWQQVLPRFSAKLLCDRNDTLDTCFLVMMTTSLDYCTRYLIHPIFRLLLI